PSATTSNVRASLLHVLQVVLCMLPGDISACVMSYIVHRLLCVAPSRGQSPPCALFSWTGSLLPPPPTGLTGKRFTWGTLWRVCDLNACLRLMRPTWNRTPPTRCVPGFLGLGTRRNPVRAFSSRRGATGFDTCIPHNGRWGGYLTSHALPATRLLSAQAPNAER